MQAASTRANDLLHNADRLAEDGSRVVERALGRAGKVSPAKLSKTVRDFGSARAERLLEPVLQPSPAR